MSAVARGQRSAWQAAVSVVLLVALTGALLPMAPAGAQAPSGDEDSGEMTDRAGATAAGQDSTDEPDGAFDARDGRPSEGDLDELERVAESDGSVRAILGLRVAFVPEGSARAQEVQAQRAAIARERAALNRDLQGSGHRVTRSYGTVPFVAMELPPAAVEHLRQSDRVASVQVDEERAPELAQSSPLMQATNMWDENLTGDGVMVAILDTGVDSSHPFFGGRVVEEACYSTNGTNLTSLCPGGATSATGPGTGLHCTGVTGCDHGTHVAGIAAGAGDVFSGVGKGADIMSVQVFTRRDASCGPGQSPPCLRALDSDILAGLERVHLINQGAQTTVAAANLSLGGGQFSSACDATSPSVKAAVDNLRSAGAATVVSSGNEGWTDSIGWPACISTTVAVGSTTKADAVSVFSNGHPTLVDLLATGEPINSSVPGGGYAIKGGTSMAAPQVTGAWALLRSHLPGADVGTILTALKTTGLMVTDSRGPSSFDLPRIRIYQAAFGETPPPATALNEGFETVVPPGWTALNRSSNPDAPWFQGNAGMFPAHGGPDDSYAGANFTSTTGVGTISNWLVSPLLDSLGDGGVLSFATRSAASSYPDRLEVRISTNGSCAVGSSPTDVGDFDILVESINPDLEVGGYPGSWTVFEPTLSGIGAANEGCIAFRYFVTDSGPDGANGDYIGIDSVTYTTTATPSPPLAVGAVPGNGQAVVSWSMPADDGGSPVTGYTATASPGGAQCTTTTALSCSITGLTNGTTYSVVVTATNAVGTSLPSAPATVTPVTVPSPPLAVGAVPGNGQAVVSWSVPADDGGSSVTGYTATASPGGAQCTTAGALGCTITGLTNGTTYSVVVTATNAVGTSLPSAPATVTPVTVPSPPLAVGAVPGNGQAVVSWSVPADDGGSPVTGYTATASPGGAQCTTTTSLSCSITGLTNGTSYNVVVNATNAVGTSQPSDPATVTPAVAAIPSAPLGVTAVPGNQQAVVSWSAPSDGGGSSVTGYTATASPGGAQCTTAGALGCTITGLTNGTTYSVVVTATNAVGTSQPSDPATVTPATVPSTPRNVTAQPGNQSAAVSWDAPLSTGGSPITGYQATASPGNHSCPVTTSLTCTIPGLTNGTTYSVVVTATNAMGTSSPSGAVAVTPRTLPSAPRNVTAQPGNQSAAVSWAAPSSTGGSPITGYQATASPGGRSCSTSGARSCTITGLTNGTSYSVRVTATSAVGTSSPSGAVSVTPRTAPSAPRNVTGAAGDRAVAVSWAAPSSTGGSPITGYRATASPGGRSCTTSGARGCTITGLTNGTRYTFTVRASNGAGTGPASTASVPRWPTSPTQFGDVPAGAFFYGPVYWLAQRGVTTGCTPTAFCPLDDVTRAQTATFIWRLAGSPPPSGPAFADVPPGSYFADATRWMRANGLTTGVGGTNFYEPYRATSRAEFVTLLYRFAGEPTQAANHGFADVPPGSYFEAAVAWAKHHGITTGVGGTNLFDPHRTVTRAEAAAFLVRYATTPAARGSKAVPIGV